MKVVATIEARMGSSRFPGKTMARVLGRPMLELQIERMKRVPEIDDIVVATTTEMSDDVLEAAAKEWDVRCFRGSSDDVLSRVVGAARSAKADVIVETCGDCPLIDPETMSGVINLYRTGEYDYVSNHLCEGYPRGLDTQAFPLKLLEEIDSFTQDPADREHVSLYFYEHPEKYRLGCYETPAHLRAMRLRLTVDTPEDLGLIRSIYDRLYPTNPAFSIDDVANLLKNEPELLELNAHIEQKPLRA